MNKKINSGWLLVIATIFFMHPISLIYPSHQDLPGIETLQEYNNSLSKKIQSKDQEQEILRLSWLIEEALTKNPGIKAAHQDYLAARNKIPQVRSLADPVLKYTHFIENVETRVGPQENILSVSQTIPFYEKRSLRADIASQEAKAALELYEAKKRIVIAQIKKLFYELFYIYKAIDINKEEKALLRRLSKIASVKYSTGAGSQQNILQIQVEITKLNDKLLTLEQQQQTIESNIKSLLNRPKHLTLPRPEEVNESHFPYDLETLYDMAQKNRQEIKVAEAMIRENESSLHLSKKEYYPDFTFGIQYVDVGRRSSFIDNDGKDSWSVSMMINLPIWKKRLKAGVHESLAIIEASNLLRNDIENQTLFEVEDTYFRLRTAEDVLNLYSTTLIPQAEQSFKSAESGYQTGRSDFFNLLDSERVLLAVHLAYYRAITNHEQSVADLERYVGIDLASE